MKFSLVALDMDGTLLNERGEVPASFWEILAELHSRNIVVAPASGRQLATLRSMFSEVDPGAFIAENGTVVYHDGAIVSTTMMETQVVEKILQAAATAPQDLELVVCTPEVAFVRPDLPPAITDEINKYYHSTAEVADFFTLLDEPALPIIKIAAFAHANAEETIYPLLRGAASPEHAAVAISGEHWIDCMAASANKGEALEALAKSLHLDLAETIAFGDFLNDKEMLEKAGTSYAMANAHPVIKELADQVIASNAQEGVVRTLRQLLDVAR